MTNNNRLGEVMDTIEMKYTAKQAMQSIVECLNDGTEKAIQIITIQRIAESERKLFAKMFGHWLHKQKRRAFLVANSTELLNQMVKNIETGYRGIKIVGTATWELQGMSDDKILNRINGAEADCVIASLPLDIEETFTKRNRLSLHAKVWIGLGTKRDWEVQISFFSRVQRWIAAAKVKKNKNDQ